MKQYALSFSETEIQKVAKQFLELIDSHKHFAFYGSMGAGKTTFIKALCHSIGTPDLVSSPTFAIVNEYSTAADTPIFHFDFYRIKEAEELLDIGFYDYCSPKNFCFIEWPEKAESIIPETFIPVKIQALPNELRELSFSL